MIGFAEQGTYIVVRDTIFLTPVLGHKEAESTTITGKNCNDVIYLRGFEYSELVGINVSGRY